MNNQISQKQRKTGRGSSPNSQANLKPFVKGQSGNPGGLPKGTPKVSIALMKLLAGDHTEAFEARSRADKLALAIYEKALKGDVSAIREIADRTEGKAPSTVNVNRGDDPKAERYRNLAQELAAKYDKPVDEVVRDIVERDPETAAYFQDWVM